MLCMLLLTQACSLKSRGSRSLCGAFHVIQKMRCSRQITLLCSAMSRIPKQAAFNARAAHAIADVA